MSSRCKRIVRSAWALVLAATVGASACSKFGGYCDRQIECVEGNDADRNACIERLQGREAAAKALECGDEFNRYFECMEVDAVCYEGYFGDLDLACFRERDELSECADIEFADLRF